MINLEKFNEMVQHHYDIPFEWGVSDCYMIMHDCFLAATGENLFDNVKYKTELGASKHLKKRGFDNLFDALSSRLTASSPMTGMRGDLGVTCVDGIYSGGVFTALGFMTKGENSGIVILPHSEVHTVFKV